jgi:general stress protein CsbA
MQVYEKISLLLFAAAIQASQYNVFYVNFYIKFSDLESLSKGFSLVVQLPGFKQAKFNEAVWIMVLVHCTNCV